jgi:hypothetical protein
MISGTAIIVIIIISPSSGQEHERRIALLKQLTEELEYIQSLV